MKIIKTVDTLIERAERNGESHASRNGVQVYATEANNMRGGMFRLFHYGTETVILKHTDSHAVLVGVYGESVSDAESLNTVMNYYGIPVQFGFRPVNGGFYGMLNDGTTVYLDSFSGYDASGAFANALEAAMAM